MRQVGLLAAAGVYALQNNVERLRDDHDNANRFADLFRGCKGLTVDYDEAGTNLLFIHCHEGAVDPLEFLKRLEEVRSQETAGVCFQDMQPNSLLLRPGFGIGGRCFGTWLESDGNNYGTDHN